MLRFFRNLLFLLLCFLQLSFNYSAHRLLDDQDFDLEEEWQNNPALTRDDGSSSYYQWLCFDPDWLKVDCSKHCFKESIEECEDSGWTEWPNILIRINDQLFDFDYEFDHLGDCRQILQEWNNIIRENSGICLFSAYFQDFPPEDDVSHHLYFILHSFKTSYGVWRPN